jgi:hypothetical protein
VALLPNIGAFLPRASDEQTACNNLEAWLAWCRQLVGGSPLPTALRISGGNVTPTTGRFVVDTGGAPVQLATDTLSHIIPTNFPDGFRICVSIADASRTVTFKHQAAGSGQMTLIYGVDFVVASSTVRLYFELQGTAWVEMAPRGWGAMTGSEKAALGINDAAGNPTATQAEATAGTADDRNMTPLKVRQALTNKNWFASLAVLSTPVVDPDKLLLSDGINVYQVAITGANGLLAGVPRRYGTSDATLVPGSFHEVNHGLGVMPSLIQVRLLCLVTDLSFPAGQEVVSFDLNPYASSTLVGWTAASTVGVNDGAGTYRTVTPARWQVRTRYWA